MCTFPPSHRGWSSYPNSPIDYLDPQPRRRWAPVVLAFLLGAAVMFAVLTQLTQGLDECAPGYQCFVLKRQATG